MVACRIGVTSGVWVCRKVVFMCVGVGGLRKCCRKKFWGNSPSIGVIRMLFWGLRKCRRKMF